MIQVEQKVLCHHCGEECRDEHINYDKKDFCCVGCKSIYELFQEDDLKELYQSRNKSNPHLRGKYDFLRNDEIKGQLLNFQSTDHSIIHLDLPDIHCSSCVYVLENLNEFHDGVIQTKVNFMKRAAEVHFDPRHISLEELAILLSSIGYPPEFNAADGTKKGKSIGNRISLKIGVAAFCFGNIMLLSFPEYLGIKDQMSHDFDRFFSYLNLFLVLPAFFFSGKEYFISAYKGLKRGFVNIDVPIALGMAILFIRSTYEIISATGSGYMDSLAGLIFFLLIGKWFQNKTYENLSFDRDYKSYFPLAVLKRDGDQEVPVPIQQLQEGDEIIIRNQEIIPADAVLLSDSANIDYSFVTGEQRAVKMDKGEHIYAGGRQAGERIYLKVLKATSQSYLTSLWNSDTFLNKKDSVSMIDRISKYFTIAIFTIAIVSSVFWYFIDPSQIWLVATSVLIVACPCALALSAPFTHGNTMRILGRNRFYLKSAEVAEKLTNVNTIVFDKTGTITTAGDHRVTYSGSPMKSVEKSILKGMTANSTHPLSKRIYDSLEDVELMHVDEFEEIVGKGIRAVFGKKVYKLGSSSWALHDNKVNEDSVFFSENDQLIGSFQVTNYYRPGLTKMVGDLSLLKYDLELLSGDNHQEEKVLKNILPQLRSMLFKQKPDDKLNYVKSLQRQHHKVLMLGDGLNDAGALSQSDVGIAVAEDVSAFSPACDAIIEGASVTKLSEFLQYVTEAKKIVIASFVISFLYNVVGLSFAVVGWLTPVFAAVLMPLSSITVVAFTTIAGNLLARKLKL
ncbi:heavy metal translocating P-type ATPase metal-binding domain-containing protein [Fulvivirga maritima]|uniref:heavy metal translocating P-type ATPase n=1 Tax=Fulvivirga maritima TaxID=2904247 RepID=UPI001F3B9947|nr:heavy metal translocating P-type ATPase metal-binding domain-containing protein [Fulvivirga maritima]UII25575.1 heavy metal translocating P-type ATPase metal-binding domain-containing protein [Fulvivirga maritima]